MSNKNILAKSMAIRGVQVLAFGLFWLALSSLWFVFGHNILGYIFVALGLTMLVIGIARLWYDLRSRLVVVPDNRQMIELIVEEEPHRMIIPPR